MARFVAPLALFVVGAGVYLPTLENGFVNWDDREYVTHNSFVNGQRSFAEIWTNTKEQQQYYPMVFSTFWLERWLCGGFEPRVLHATSLTLHGINCALLLWAFLAMGIRPRAAVLAAAIFAVHPVMVSSVAWTVERKNVLSQMFYLLTFLAFVRHLRHGGWVMFGVAIFVYVCCLLSKTATLTLPLTLLATDRLIRGRWSARTLARVVPFLALSLFFAVLTARVEAEQATGNVTPVIPPLRPLIAAAELWWYVAKLLVPLYQLPLYRRWEVGFDKWWLWAAFLSGVLALVAVWRFRRRLPPPILWGMAQFVIGLAPALGLKHFNYTQFSFVADHFLYLSIPAFALVVAILLDGAARRGPGPAVGVGILVAGVLPTLAYRSWNYGKVWKNSETFWKTTLDDNPNCLPGNFNLANYLTRNNRPAEALPYYQKTIKIRPSLPGPYLGAAEALQRQGQYQRAEKVIRDLLARRPGAVAGLQLLARILRRSGQHDLLLEEMARAVQSYPREPILRLEYGAALVAGGRHDEAIVQYEQAIELKPQAGRVHSDLGMLYHQKQRYGDAVAEQQKALERNPRLLVAMKRLADSLEMMGDEAGATKQYREYLRHRPNDKEAQQALTRLIARGAEGNNGN